MLVRFKELQGALDVALSQLSDKHKRVIEMRMFQGGIGGSKGVPDRPEPTRHVPGRANPVNPHPSPRSTRT